MKQLIYASTAVGDPAPTALAVLERAAVFNVSRHITGILLVGQSGFAQLLEGAASDIDDLYDRIRSDPRHRDVRTVSVMTVERRLWPTWAMHVVASTQENIELLRRHGLDFRDDWAALPATRLKALLYAFSEMAHQSRAPQSRLPDAERLH